MQRVLEILYDKCEQSDENAPLLRRRDIWERHALRNSENCCAPRCATKTCPARWTCACPTSTCTPDRGVFGSICWSDRLKGDIWPRVERMLRAAIDTLRFSPHLRLAQAA